MKAQIPFKKLQSPSELCEYLRKAAQKHSHYHHYASLDTLRIILEMHTLRLTRATSRALNDQHEILAKGRSELRERMYISCLNYARGESMAMWGLYGVPHDSGARITFPQASMLQLLEKPAIKCVNDLDVEISEVYLSDIAYISGAWGQSEANFYRGHNRAIIKSDDANPLSSLKEFTGVIKNKAWEFENEVRIIAECRLSEDMPDYIDLNIPKNILSTLKITLSPCIEPDRFVALESEYMNKYGVEVVKSNFDQLVNFKECNKRSM